VAKNSRAVSVAELGENPGRVVRRVRDSKQPVMVTERGRAQAVLLGVDAFERNERERQILHELARGEREIASGHGSRWRRCSQMRTRSWLAFASDRSLHTRWAPSVSGRRPLHRRAEPSSRKTLSSSSGEESSPAGPFPCLRSSPSGVPGASSSRGHRSSVSILLPSSRHCRLGGGRVARCAGSKTASARSTPYNKAMELTSLTLAPRGLLMES
jgi:prevent-host-death family protein